MKIPSVYLFETFGGLCGPNDDFISIYKFGMTVTDENRTWEPCIRSR